jgi:hypothetical protein
MVDAQVVTFIFVAAALTLLPRDAGGVGSLDTVGGE